LPIASIPRRRIGLSVVLLWAGLSVPLCQGVSAAQDVEHGFVDVYVGVTRLFESDVPTWKFADDARAVGGARFGVWLGQNWGVTLRTWYHQTDAREEGGLSPSDLAFLGLSLELLGRWPLGDRWALYGSLGPALVVNTLDRQIDPATGQEDDARSVAVGASGAVGVEFRILKRLRAFGEVQSSLVYPSFEFRDQTITPRLINLNGLAGIRFGF
jgi:Outer membrane protein beta-barrel domain